MFVVYEIFLVHSYFLYIQEDEKVQQCFVSCWKLDLKVNLKGQALPAAVGQEGNQAVVLAGVAMEDILIITDRETVILTINFPSSEKPKDSATKLY